ncbi:MAG: BamA/TamA family outer membrane protein [Rikenellaceae bacterium]
MGGCGVTRQIPDGKYLLNHVEIEGDESAPKEERIPPYDIEQYVRQSPNKRLFGTNFYIWTYNSAKADRDNWWNRFKRKVGEEPIYYNDELTQKSLENIKIYMDSEGFYGSQCYYHVDTITKRKRANITYFMRQNTPYIIDSISCTFKDTTLRDIVLSEYADSKLHVGDIFSISRLEKQREWVTSKLRNSGYYNFTVDNITFTADTLQGNNRVRVEMIVNKFLEGYDNRGNAIMVDNRAYKLSKVNIFTSFFPTKIISDQDPRNKLDTLSFNGLNIIHPQGEQPNLRPRILKHAVTIQADSLYNAAQVRQTYQNLISIGYFKSARINFREDTISKKETPLPYGLLSGNILCTPSKKQSFNIELEASTTSSFYGLKTTLGYQNRNLFRGAENLNIDFTMAYEDMKAPDAAKSMATEFGLTTKLSVPRFLIPIDSRKFSNVLKPRTNIEASVNLQDRPYYDRTLSSISWSYSWLTKKYASLSVRPIDVNLIKMNYIDEDYYDQLENEYLKNSYETQLITGASFSYAYNNQAKRITGNATMFRFNVETAGNLASLVVGAVGGDDKEADYNELFGIRYAQYFRADANISRKIKLGLNTSIVGRLYVGFGQPYGNSDAIPFDRLFYAGGSNSMRGWAPRTLGPGSSTLPEDMVYPSQLGDMKLETNIEFRFPIWENIFGATFFDVGNVWYAQDEYSEYDPESVFHFNSFYKQLGFNTGIGIRLDIKFAILRLDWGVQLHNPNLTEGERWISKFDFDNTALNFGVGYPF